MGRRALALGAFCGMVSPGLLWAPGSGWAQAPGESALFTLRGVSDARARSAIAATGAVIWEVGPDSVLVEADAEALRALERSGLAPRARREPPPLRALAPRDFPERDSLYHDYGEMTLALAQAQEDHADIFSLFSLGTSGEGREIWAGKISDDPGVDDAEEPEVLFTYHQHAREHLTVEQALDTLEWLTDGYASDPAIARWVDSREIWMVFDMNPDGGEHDIGGTAYRSWRKNRQPNAGGSIGTDLNRNWGYRWGCCRGSSGNGGSATYRGAEPFSAPETAVVRDFVARRVVAGVQQITVAIDFHSYGELVLWPYGYTYEDAPADMAPDDAAALAAMGREMAARNGYTAEQASDLYLTDGTIDDWLYGAHGIFSYTFELAPRGAGGGGFYPDDEVIAAETARNRSAIAYLLEQADCPYRAIGLEALYCGAPGPGPAPGSGRRVWFEDFEGETSDWTVNPDGADRAVRGAWEIADPQATRVARRPLQLGEAYSGVRALVTGPGGGPAGRHDVDRGVTRARSGAISLEGLEPPIALRLRAYLAHWRNGNPADFLRVRVASPAGSRVVLERTGAREYAAPGWTLYRADLSDFAGQSIRIEVECSDEPRASTLECALDDLEITAGD